MIRGETINYIQVFPERLPISCRCKPRPNFRPTRYIHSGFTLKTNLIGSLFDRQEKVMWANLTRDRKPAFLGRADQVDRARRGDVRDVQVSPRQLRQLQVAGHHRGLGLSR